MADDRARTDDRDVEHVARRRSAGELLGRELRLAVLLHRRRLGVLVDRVPRGTPKMALDEVWTILRTPARAPRPAGSRCRRWFTDQKSVAILRERDLRDVVVDDVDLPARARDGAGSRMSPARYSTSAGAIVGVGRDRRPHARPLEQPVAQQAPKIPEPPVISARTSSCRSDLLTVRQAPLDRRGHALAEREPRCVAELAFGLRDRAGDRLIHLAEHVDLLVGRGRPLAGRRRRSGRPRRPTAAGASAGAVRQRVAERLEQPRSRWRRSR